MHSKHLAVSNKGTCTKRMENIKYTLVPASAQPHPKGDAQEFPCNSWAMEVGTTIQGFRKQMKGFRLG